MRKLYLRNVTEKDKELLFQWANDSDVRKNSFISKNISEKEHERWFRRVMEDDNVKQYIFMEDENAVGQIRFDIKDECAIISYSISCNNRGRGLASEMIKAAEKKILEDRPDVKIITAEVKPENYLSLKVFERLGYRQDCIHLSKKPDLF